MTSMNTYTRIPGEGRPLAEAMYLPQVHQAALEKGEALGDACSVSVSATLDETARARWKVRIRGLRGRTVGGTLREDNIIGGDLTLCLIRAYAQILGISQNEAAQRLFQGHREMAR